ncbi:prepilin peptidase [Cellulomonas humilata]|uniref:Prepilin leader peptidase/N-methyltransferase n=1 Tax=Cellulomonas humilata TaxID=144055 RepID=A0ABU0EF61_9CELL|nr:A24 family peptidase [Cellulomonas humilata]MDQ0373902.1 leader peptidase (prepilin peptidase)/N-methyltransferase [Cellulomonas humilata]
MTVVLYALVGLLGLAIGSFLNVVIWRVPRGESITHPPSACPTCGHAIRARDNVPLVSWLLLRGRCRDCSSPISARYPLVELATGVLFVVVTVWVGFDAPAVWALPAFLYLAAVSVALAMIDIDTKTLPDKIVLPSYVVAIVLLAVASWGAGDWGALLRAGLGCVVLWTFYFVVVFAYPKGMGFGDVKLAGLLGLYLGWVGWGALAVGSFAAFLLGGVFSIGLLLLRRAGRKTGIPFGPWMLLGAAVGLAWGEQIFQAYLDLML